MLYLMNKLHAKKNSSVKIIDTPLENSYHTILKTCVKFEPNRRLSSTLAVMS